MYAFQRNSTNLMTEMFNHNKVDSDVKKVFMVKQTQTIEDPHALSFGTSFNLEGCQRTDRQTDYQKYTLLVGDSDNIVSYDDYHGCGDYI